MNTGPPRRKGGDSPADMFGPATCPSNCLTLFAIAQERVGVYYTDKGWLWVRWSLRYFVKFYFLLMGFSVETRERKNLSWGWEQGRVKKKPWMDACGYAQRTKKKKTFQSKDTVVSFPVAEGLVGGGKRFYFHVFFRGTGLKVFSILKELMVGCGGSGCTRNKRKKYE